MTGQLNLSATTQVPFTRLVGVELRKARDTRAGFWLLVGTALIVVVVLGIATVITLVRSDLISFGELTTIAAYMTSFLLPILAIMLVTSEWSQRTALVTFTLEPRRSRVVLAKLVVAQLLTVLTLVVAFVVGVVCTAICQLAQPDLTSWAIGLGDLAGWLVTQTLTMLGGFALADPVAQHTGVDRGVRGLPVRAAGHLRRGDRAGRHPRAGRALGPLPGRPGRHLRLCRLYF